ncbi:MAG TPA: hypothetical protein VJZ00_04970 [Thermoanaerobaculia bacterium]|nr:hypothetical protein [Thermoanaerobaculia bacterium]
MTAERGPIHAKDARLFNGDKALTEEFAAIDSFDYSASRGEVVFSAKRKDRDNFDVGLVSSDGSPISWMPSPDPADEVAVQWAPRGNKVSYIVRAKGGDAVRTVHIPTATQLTNAFPNATIRTLTWDAEAEHYTVAYSTPDASERVEVLKYDGTSRKITVPPAVTIDAEVEPFAKDAILLKPRDIEYEERLPLAIWVANDFAWSDARAALLKNARGAIIITTREPDAELWKRVNETAWLDAKHAIVVNPQATSHQQHLTITTNATLTDNYKRTGNTIEVPPSVIQSFAAGFIADQWKRTPPAHGRSR